MHRSGRTNMPYFKGGVRAYVDAVKLGVIAVRIRGLVSALNVEGVVATSASCEGHGWLGRITSPYVAFATDVERAQTLSEMLAVDSLAARPLLQHLWTITGHFDSNNGLLFRLAVPALEARSIRTSRGALDADFERLRLMAEQVFKHTSHCEAALA